MRVSIILRQITKRQLDRQGSVAKIKEWMPFELTLDGEVVALVMPPSLVDSQPAKRATLTDKLTELPLSKKRQSAGFLSS